MASTEKNLVLLLEGEDASCGSASAAVDESVG